MYSDQDHWPGPQDAGDPSWRINDCHQSHHQRLIVLSPGQQIMTGQEKKTRWWMTLLATPDCPRCCSGLWCVGCGFMVEVVVHSIDGRCSLLYMVVVVPVSWWRLNGVLAHCIGEAWCCKLIWTESMSCDLNGVMAHWENYNVIADVWHILTL